MTRKRFSRKRKLRITKRNQRKKSKNKRKKKRKNNRMSGGLRKFFKQFGGALIPEQVDLGAYYDQNQAPVGNATAAIHPCRELTLTTYDAQSAHDNTNWAGDTAAPLLHLDNHRCVLASILSRHLMNNIQTQLSASLNAGAAPGRRFQQGDRWALAIVRIDNARNNETVALAVTNPVQ